MLYMFFSIILYLLVSFAVFFVWKLFFFRLTSKAKMGSIEAGFSSLEKSSQISFSMQFIIIVIVFVAFDLEILFLSSMVLKLSLVMVFVFLLFISATLFIEWFFGKLTWIH